MGISERDYGRYNPPGYGQFGSMGSRMGGRARSFSVTTWIIIACVAIFVIDGFLQSYSSWVETGTRYVDNGDGTWRKRSPIRTLTSPICPRTARSSHRSRERSISSRETIRSSRRPSLGCR